MPQKAPFKAVGMQNQPDASLTKSAQTLCDCAEEHNLSLRRKSWAGRDANTSKLVRISEMQLQMLLARHCAEWQSVGWRLDDNRDGCRHLSVRSWQRCKADDLSVYASTETAKYSAEEGGCTAPSNLYVASHNALAVKTRLHPFNSMPTFPMLRKYEPMLGLLQCTQALTLC